ncbi:penicillin acylase family protein [Amycolatopsis halotolerans]|uniref:Penicillin acylase family protein n=1 Tax=Amycolatopsis halotolerans TaxID=330083 RepID=A0ABV7QQW8_9PSEU
MASRRRPRTGLSLAFPAAALLVATTATVPAMATDHGPDQPTIRYTEYGIPHIIASNWEGIGEGYGYAAAKDNICTLADTYLTVNGRRSRFLGPDGKASPGEHQNTTTNLNSDLYFQRINDNHVVERLAAQPAPDGPEPEVKEAIHGYVQGYNRYLAETGADNISDPACRGAAWVRPIAESDVYRHAHAEIIMGSAEALLDGEVNAAPSVAAAPPRALPAEETARRIADAVAAARRQGMGSNALAVGAQGVSGGTAMLLANPHFPWQGKNRMWQSHLTIPGQADVSGASLLGFPAVNIGHNNDVAWSHTVATVAPFGLFDVQVDPLHPTVYLVDGKWENMTSQQVSVEVLNKDGSLGTVTRTLWSTRYGPITTSLQGVPLPWVVSAHAVRDVNMDNLRALNTWFRLDRAKDVHDVVSILERTQGVPFFNTVAADRKGNALYADIQAAPNITDEHAQSCLTLTGQLLFNQVKLPDVPPISIFDGKRGECDWPNDPNAAAPGVLDPHRQPRLIRSDFVGNANDSAWLSNPAQPLAYPRVMGDSATPRSLRTQQLILTAQNRINGADGLPGRGFTPETMRQLLFADRSRAADLALDSVVSMCRDLPFGVILVDGVLVNVSEACPILAGWKDHSYTVASRGSWLFENFWFSLSGGDLFKSVPWRVPFDVRDPVHTPNSLDTGNSAVHDAFGRAVIALRNAGIPLDAPLSDIQKVTRNGEQIPVHGSLSDLGVLNVISPGQNGDGTLDVVFGSSFVQEVRFAADGPPQASSVLTYSQSADPTSPHYADQTKLFSAGQWVPERFTEDQIAASPALKVVVLN